MKQLVSGLATFAVASLIGVILLSTLGVVSFQWPSFFGGITSETREIAAPEEVEIVSIEPITLDCRARITAHVPVEGRKEHRVAGQVYRTDTMRMTAIGDIDTCVDASKIEVLNVEDGARILVPADAIRFERPRVDAVASMGSARFSKGFLGKLTDAFPWVDDAEGLTGAGYAFAQQTIGSSACMEVAYERTLAAMEYAYRALATSQGLDPDNVRIDVTGTPDFDQQPPSRLDDFDFDVDTDVTCAVAGLGPITGDV